MLQSNPTSRVFAHEQFGDIRSEMIDGFPYLCAKDVAAALGFGNTRQAIATHCKRTVTSPTLNYRGNYFIMLPESDVYRLVMRSNLPSALDFQDWVFEEVLPSLRQDGQYNTLYPATGNPILDDLIRAQLQFNQAAQQT